MKKVIILFALISAYVLVMGHSIVPHHHHDSVEQSAHDQEHHNDDHPIDDCEQHEGLPEFFSNFVHDSHTITEIQTIGKQIEKSLINEFHFICVTINQPGYSTVFFNSDHPPGKPEFPPSLFIFSGRPLRAPPVC